MRGICRRRAQARGQTWTRPRLRMAGIAQALTRNERHPWHHLGRVFVRKCSSTTPESDTGRGRYLSDIFTAGILRRSIAAGCVFCELSPIVEYRHDAPLVFHQFGAPSSEIFSSTVSLCRSSSMSAWRSERSMVRKGKMRARHNAARESPYL
jgi:hypothetical protein